MLHCTYNEMLVKDDVECSLTRNCFSTNALAIGQLELKVTGYLVLQEKKSCA